MLYSQCYWADTDRDNPTTRYLAELYDRKVARLAWCFRHPCDRNEAADAIRVPD
jgi:hypothetical protein